VVTADWLNQSLTLLDYDRLIDGESDAASAIVDTIDLSEWERGPIELELTPDGKMAVVSAGSAFFDGTGVTNSPIGSPEVPPGGAFPLTAAVDKSDSFEFVAHIEDKALPIIDLSAGAQRAVTLRESPGPAYVAVQP
jgi:hypothetical protein